VLWDLVYIRHEHNPLERPHDARYFGESVLEQAEKYLARDWMHTPWLTNRLVVDLLDSVIGTLAAEITAPDPSRFTAGLPWPWGILVPKLLSFLFFVGSVIGIALAFAVDLPWVGWAGIGYVAWHYFWRFRRNYLLSKIRGDLAAWVSRLEWIRDEVKRGTYDPAEIADRLRKPEEKGFVIPSLVFPLLKLSCTLGLLQPHYAGQFCVGLIDPTRAPIRNGLARSPAVSYRITSSAWNRSGAGIVKPRASAVLRLMTNSNRTGCCTGSSPGLAPFRILST
jgi:hypothetical protein